MQVTPYISIVASVPESAACKTSSTINDSDMLAERGWQEPEETRQRPPNIYFCSNYACLHDCKGGKDSQTRSALGKTMIPVMVRNGGDGFDVNSYSRKSAYSGFLKELPVTKSYWICSADHISTAREGHLVSWLEEI